MQRREKFWIVVLLLLGSLFVYNRHQSRKTEIIISASFRPPRGRRNAASVYPVYFTLDSYYKLTSVEVVTVESNAMNIAGHSLWHLVSKSNSAPIKLFTYGQGINGMHSDLKGVKPEALVPNVKYRLKLAAGALKGSASFQTRTIPK